MIITPEEVISAAREVGFLKRNGGKIDPFDFLMALVFRMSQSFPPALNTIISFLKKPVSRSGLHQKFTDKAVSFFRRCLELIMVKQLMQSEIIDTSLLEHFKRVLVVDILLSFQISENNSSIY